MQTDALMDNCIILACLIYHKGLLYYAQLTTRTGPNESVSDCSICAVHIAIRKTVVVIRQQLELRFVHINFGTGL